MPLPGPGRNATLPDRVSEPSGAHRPGVASPFAQGAPRRGWARRPGQRSPVGLALTGSSGMVAARAVRDVGGAPGSICCLVSGRGGPARGGSCPRSRPAAWPGRRPSRAGRPGGAAARRRCSDSAGWGGDRLLLTREQRRNPHGGGQRDSAALYLDGVGVSGVGHGQLPRGGSLDLVHLPGDSNRGGYPVAGRSASYRAAHPTPSRSGRGPVLDGAQMAAARHTSADLESV